MSCTENSYSKDQDRRVSIHATDPPFSSRLLNIQFADNSSALKYCQNLCAEFGVTVKHESQANGIVYVLCEGFMGNQSQPNRECWRFVLSETDPSQWTFRADLQQNSAGRMPPPPEEDMLPWPAEVHAMIASLAQQVQQIDPQDARDAFQRQFPTLIWNERRFSHQLMEEYRRIQQQKAALQTRVCRMVHLSAQLSAVAAGSEESAQNVERDLIRMLDHFGHLAHMTPDTISSLVDLKYTKVGEEPVSAAVAGPKSLKKRKSASDNDPQQCGQKGVQCVGIPGFTINVRSQPLRAASLSSQGSRRTSESSGVSSPAHLHGFSTRQQPSLTAAAVADPANFVLSQQVDDLINMTYQHNIHSSPFSPGGTTTINQGPAFGGDGDEFWPPVKEGQPTPRYNNSANVPMPSDSSNPNSNIIFY